MDGEWSDGASIGTWVDILTSTNETFRASLLSGRLSSVCLSVCLPLRSREKQKTRRYTAGTCTRIEPWLSREAMRRGRLGGMSYPLGSDPAEPPEKSVIPLAQKLRCSCT